MGSYWPAAASNSLMHNLLRVRRTQGRTGGEEAFQTPTNQSLEKSETIKSLGFFSKPTESLHVGQKTLPMT